MPVSACTGFQKSFLLQLVEDREVDETPWIGGLASREFFHGVLAPNAKLRNKIVPLQQSVLPNPRPTLTLGVICNNFTRESACLPNCPC